MNIFQRFSYQSRIDDGTEDIAMLRKLVSRYYDKKDKDAERLLIRYLLKERNEDFPASFVKSMFYTDKPIFELYLCNKNKNRISSERIYRYLLANEDFLTLKRLVSCYSLNDEQERILLEKVTNERHYAVTGDSYSSVLSTYLAADINRVVMAEADNQRSLLALDTRWIHMLIQHCSIEYNVFNADSIRALIYYAKKTGDVSLLRHLLSRSFIVETNLQEIIKNDLDLKIEVLISDARRKVYLSDKYHSKPNTDELGFMLYTNNDFNSDEERSAFVKCHLLPLMRRADASLAFIAWSIYLFPETKESIHECPVVNFI